MYPQMPDRRRVAVWKNWERALILFLVTVPTLALIGMVASANWPEIRGSYFVDPSLLHQTKGLVTASDVYTDSNKYGVNYHYLITYEYAVGGQAYSSQQVTFGPHGFDTPEEAAAYTVRYPVGSSVQVYYVANDPAFAVLEPNVRDGDFLIFVGLMAVFPILMVLLIVINAIQAKNASSQ